jgi:ferritin-like metal-binding protein YciE
VIRKPRPVAGRYEGAAKRQAYMPATGLGVPPANVRTALAAVPDPYDAERNVLVRVNTAENVLDYMRTRKAKHGRISEAAYQVGMIVKAVFERANGRPRSTGWMVDSGSRVDAFTAKELAVIHGIDNAARLVAMVKNLAREIGQRDARLLQRVLGEEKTFHEVATIEGKGGDRGARYIRQRFRDALEDLAEVRAARGRRGYNG